eukprot:g9313.t1
MGPVDETRSKKELQEECKRRGIAGYSRLNKASLLRALKTGAVTPAASGSGTDSSRKDLTKRTVAELREECRQRGLRNYSRLKKDELIRLLRGGASVVENGSENRNSGAPRERTLEELRGECRERGMTGFSHLKKQELIRRMQDYDSPGKTAGSGTKCSPAGRGKIARTILGKVGGKQKREQQRRSARKKGPLRSRAQERFDAGPSPQDTPGFLYVYSEPGNGNGSSGVDDGSGVDRVREWKIGKTILDPPERRMKQSAQNNRKVYKLHASWYVPWCGYVEKIVHLDLDDCQVVPAKEKKWAGGGREDGGTEWFRADIDVIEARVKLVIRMVAAREADEADLLGVPAFCGVFRCGLPKRRWRQNDRPAVQV